MFKIGMNMFRQGYDQYASNENNVWKINIIIDLTTTNEKKFTIKMLQEIVPIGESWREHGEWHQTMTSSITSQSIEVVLKTINEMLSIYGKNLGTNHPLIK